LTSDQPAPGSRNVTGSARPLFPEGRWPPATDARHARCYQARARAVLPDEGGAPRREVGGRWLEQGWLGSKPSHGGSGSSHQAKQSDGSRPTQPIRTVQPSTSTSPLLTPAANWSRRSGTAGWASTPSSIASNA